MDSITIHFQCLLIPTHAADPFPAGLAPDIEGQVFGCAVTACDLEIVIGDGTGRAVELHPFDAVGHIGGPVLRAVVFVTVSKGDQGVPGGPAGPPTTQRTAQWFSL